MIVKYVNDAGVLVETVELTAGGVADAVTLP